MTEQTASAKIIDRIKKLIALGSNNPNEHEAEIAMRRAHKLLAEYNLTLADLPDSEKEKADPYTRDTSHVKHGKGPVAARQIANAIAKLYFCKTFFSSRPNHGDQISFVGRSTNVSIAKDISTMVISTLRAQAKIQGAGQTGFETNFMMAAASRIYVRCEALIREASEGATQNDEGTKNLPALRNTYLAELQSADSFIKTELAIKLKPSNTASRGGQGGGGYAEGRAAGDSVSLRPGLASNGRKAIGN